MVWRALALCLAVVAVAACGGSTKRFGSTSTLRKERVSAVVSVGGAPDAPDWQAQARDAVWVANSSKQTIQRIDPATNRASEAHTSIQQPCSGLTVAFGSVWAVDCANDVVVRVDAQSGRAVARIPLIAATDEGLTTATADGVFVLGQNALKTKTFLAKIDPTKNSITARIPVPAGSAAAASGFGSIWVTNPDDGLVTRFDVSHGRVAATIKTHAGPRFVATGEGAVWVLNQADGSVSKIDPQSSRVVATIPAKVPGNGGCIATGFGSVWVTMPQTPLLRIDSKSDKITERWTGPGGDCVSTGFGSVWLSNHEFGNVWRIRP